jgi:hypothetical protein
VGYIVFAIIPFCPSALWAQLIAAASNWRYNGILVGVWNLLGLIFVTIFYKDPPRVHKPTKMEILRKVDYVGGLLSIGGCLFFMMGMQWGAVQVCLNMTNLQHVADHKPSTNGTAHMSWRPSF